tara:strand:- start:2476 stop:3264 length:789 start_codon:yes stop_codon:yes gene_type:complete
MESFQEALKNTLKNQSGNNTIDTKSLQESLRKSLGPIFDTALSASEKSSSFAEKTMNSVESGMDTATNTVKTTVSKTVSGVSAFWGYFKIFLVVFIILLLGMNIYTFITKKQDALTYYFGDFFGIEQESKKEHTPTSENTSNEEDILDENNEILLDEKTQTMTDVDAEKDARDDKLQPSKLSMAIESRENNVNENDIEDAEKANKNFKANNLSVNVNKKSGYCYLGTDRGVRTCVEVGDDEVCMSNEVYPSMNTCVNPSLKE